MASRRPDLKLPIPAREQGEEVQQPSSSLRSPRFTEDFDAPFSEALLNASRTTISTDTMSYPSTSSTSRTSFGDDSSNRRQTVYQTSSPLNWPEVPWGTESKRRSSVNDRIREWAKKSMGAFKTRPEGRDGYFDSRWSRRTSSVVMTPTSGDVTPNEQDGLERVDAYSRAVVTITEVSESKSD